MCGLVGKHLIEGFGHRADELVRGHQDHPIPVGRVLAIIVPVFREGIGGQTGGIAQIRDHIHRMIHTAQHGMKLDLDLTKLFPRPCAREDPLNDGFFGIIPLHIN